MSWWLKNKRGYIGDGYLKWRGPPLHPEIGFLYLQNLQEPEDRLLRYLDTSAKRNDKFKSIH